MSGAYDILGDPDKRKAFDRGEIDGRGEPRRDGYRQYARGARAGAGAGPGGAFDEFGFGDIFSEMFNGGRGGSTRQLQREGPRRPLHARRRLSRVSARRDQARDAAGRRHARPQRPGGRRRRAGPAPEGQGLPRDRRRRGGRCAGRDPRAPARAVQAHRRRRPARNSDHGRRGGARRQGRGADRRGPRAR